MSQRGKRLGGEMPGMALMVAGFISGGPFRFGTRPRVPLKTRQQPHGAARSVPGHADETVDYRGDKSASSVHMGGHPVRQTAQPSVPCVEGMTCPLIV